MPRSWKLIRDFFSLSAVYLLTSGIFWLTVIPVCPVVGPGEAWAGWLLPYLAVTTIPCHWAGLSPPSPLLLPTTPHHLKHLFEDDLNIPVLLLSSSALLGKVLRFSKLCFTPVIGQYSNTRNRVMLNFYTKRCCTIHVLLLIDFFRSSGNTINDI